jgi:hypothetical protein
MFLLHVTCCMNANSFSLNVQIFIYQPQLHVESISDTLEPIWITFNLYSVDTFNASYLITLDICSSLGSLMLPVSTELPACYTDAQNHVTCIPRDSDSIDQEQTIRKISISATVAEINQLVGMVGYIPFGAHVETISFTTRNNLGLLPSSKQLEICTCSATGTCIQRSGAYTCKCNPGWKAGWSTRSCKVRACFCVGA